MKSTLSTSQSLARLSKPPRLILSEIGASAAPHHPAIYAFPPNRDTLGGTAYFIVESSASGSVNILVDCPAWNETCQAFLQQHGGVQWLFLTHRNSIGQAQTVQQIFDCNIVMQEQEAYLLPGSKVTTFHHTLTLTPQTRAIWTPGHSPGSSCLYHSGFGGVLFTGRHLLPTPQGVLSPIRIPKTFHWQRQLNSVQKLIDEFSPDTLNIICPGANLGFLRGQLALEQGYDRIKNALATQTAGEK
ncbi:Zn-dependent hydrolase, glyoxylase [Leptolyngbyaceae cyanobacterium JSC-12]|nr:Zn-dependent hydrolase, glyoxylase [Leptolyngbyaceae cyanobacterium JSC-12]